MKKLLFSFLCVFALESNLSAQQISNAGISSIESNGEWIYKTNEMPYNPDVPFFTLADTTDPTPEFYGMSIANLYWGTSKILFGTIELLKVDTEKLSIIKDGVYSKNPYVRVSALDDEESWNTSFKKDGNEQQQAQVPISFDTEAKAQKFIDDLKNCVKVSLLYRREAWRLKQHDDIEPDANTLENSKKRIKILEQAEALIVGKKYTQLEIILAHEKYGQYEQNITNLVEFELETQQYIPTKNAPQDASKQIYNNLAKLRAIRKNFEAKYKTFEENYYPKINKKNWVTAQCLNKVNATGRFATNFPATLAEYETILAKIIAKMQGEKQQEKQQEKKKLETANAVDASGNSPLMNAIKAKDLEKVKSLIKGGAEVTFKNPKTKSSVFKYALEIKDIAIIKELMQTKVIKEELEYSGMAKSKVYHNELMYVIEKNDAELYQLFKNGVFKQVEDDYTDKDGNYPWMIAYNLGNIDKAFSIYLFSGENNAEKQRKKDGHTILMLAIEKNDIPAAKKFTGVTSTVELNITNNDGYTALMMAAEKGQNEVVEMMLAKAVYSSQGSASGTYDPNFISDKGKMKGKKAIDVAKNKDIKKLLTKK